MCTWFVDEYSHQCFITNDECLAEFPCTRCGKIYKRKDTLTVHAKKCTASHLNDTHVLKDITSSSLIPNSIEAGSQEVEARVLRDTFSNVVEETTAIQPSLLVEMTNADVDSNGDNVNDGMDIPPPSKKLKMVPAKPRRRSALREKGINAAVNMGASPIVPYFD